MERPAARQRACLANLRVITDALAEYNKGRPGPGRIASVEDKDVKASGIMVRLGILKSEISAPTEQCKYHGVDLTGTGILVCAYHGSIAHPSKFPELSRNFMSIIANFAGTFFYYMAMIYLPVVMIRQMFGNASSE
ncbi:MAG: hypothetical protein HQM09_17305 [Candidatus Riflebacteria bacterium]|nr:hypothetical protein [Candidatus Riflebacteria bacterium]